MTKISELRKALGITQYEAAKMTGIPRWKFQGLERGDIKLGITAASDLVDTLKKEVKRRVEILTTLQAMPRKELVSEISEVHP